MSGILKESIIIIKKLVINGARSDVFFLRRRFHHFYESSLNALKHLAQPKYDYREEINVRRSVLKGCKLPPAATTTCG